MRKAFVDTETAGLHGILVKLQWEFDDEGVHMIDAWLEPLRRSIGIIERIVECHVIAHNLRFDWFHLSKWYNTCRWLIENGYSLETRPIDIPIEVMVEAEFQSQYGPCLKPPGATCTLLETQLGELQTLMNRKPVIIKRQPVQLREQLLERLEKLTAHLPQILFAKQEDPYSARWDWAEIKEEEGPMAGEVNPNFVDIRLRFKPSNALKDIAEFKLGYNPKFRMKDIDVPERYRIPAEFRKTGYMPFAKLAGPDSWPNQIRGHVDHWANDKDANQYAHDDIPLLKALYEHVGSPEPDKYGSMACQIASCRLRGMEVDLEEAQRQLDIQLETISKCPVNVNSPTQVREYIAAAMDDLEALAVAKSAKAQVLEDLCQEMVVHNEIEECCEDGCPRCDCKHAAKIFGYDLEELKKSPPKKESDREEWEQRIAGMERHIQRLLEVKPGYIPKGRMPVLARVREIQRTRKAFKRQQVYEKLLKAKKLYPSFNPIGAKSGRLSGADGFNAQAVESGEAMRSVFTLANQEEVLSMGDYDSLELIIAVVVYGDDDLMKDIESGKSLHALMACELFDMEYDAVMASKGTKDDVYKKAKIVVYSLLFGSTIAGIAHKLSLPVNVVQRAYDNFVKKYPGVAKARKGLAGKFTAISQPGGRGTQVFYNKPETHVESMFGFRRDFSIEFELLKILFDFAQDIPSSWKKIPGTSARYGNEEKAYWRHVASGLFGAAAHSIQGSVIRAALNHIIQSAGNHCTVGLQTAVWDMQPVGIKPFVLTLMSIHDEICVVSNPQHVDKVRQVVYTTINGQRESVPLLSMEWMTHATSWAGKTNKQGQKHQMGWRNPDATDEEKGKQCECCRAA